MPVTVAIFWDQRHTLPERHTGVGKHILEVTDGLCKRSDLSIRFWVAKDQEELLRQRMLEKGWEKVPVDVSRLPFRQIKWTGKPGVPMEGVDVVYSPQELGMHTGGLPSFVTLHGFPAFLEGLDPKLRNSLPYRVERVYQRQMMKRVKKSGATALVVSEALGTEACQRFGLGSGRVRVVGNGVEANFFAAAFPDRPDEKSSLLQVGGANAFDGGEVLVDLVEKMDQQTTLQIVGDRHEEPWVSKLRRDERVRFSGFLSGEALRGMMRGAKALILLPQAESFGITGVEALAIGLPVIARKVGGLEEVLGDCAMWVEDGDPDEVLAWVSKLESLSEGEYLLWQEKGRRRAEQFRWPAVVERVAALLDESKGDPGL